MLATARESLFAGGDAIVGVDDARLLDQLSATLLHHAARFGDRTVAPRLAELAGRVVGPVAGLQAAHAAAVADEDPDRLDELSARFEDVGVLLSAADAAAQAAVLHNAAHDVRRSAESASRATGLALACGRATTPALRAAVHPLPISEREREIALLVADGLTSRENAERPTVSQRTVENHIYRMYTKLGVSDREGLAALVRAQS